MQVRRYAPPRAPHRRASQANDLHRPRRVAGRALLRGVLLCAAAAMLASCRMAGVLDPKGPIAAQELLLLINTTEIMLVVVVPVILLTLGVAWWYRAGNTRANHSPEWKYQGGVEYTVWE